MTREDSSPIHQDAKLTLVSPGLLGSRLITLQSQFAPTDKQEIHNGGGSDDGGRLPRGHRTEHTLAAPPFVSVGEDSSVPLDPPPPIPPDLRLRPPSTASPVAVDTWSGAGSASRGAVSGSVCVSGSGRPRYAHSAVLAVDLSTAGPHFLWR